jgi:aspartyl-tRNA(Asn)/glutamyl-tRNA(Gln) amidotransferase subunit A
VRIHPFIIASLADCLRIPAAFCGIVGFKPSYAAIPLAGALAFSWTCDHAGPLANSVDDAARLYECTSRCRSVVRGMAPYPG